VQTAYSTLERDELQLNDGADDEIAEAISPDAEDVARVTRDNDRLGESPARASGIAGGESAEHHPNARRSRNWTGENTAAFSEVVKPALDDFLIARSESYSGLLPHPEHWLKFDVSTRERILRMAEAFTTDESARRDRLADAEIVETPKGRRAAVLIMVLCLVAAAASVLVVHNTVAAGVFLAVPVASIIRDLIRGRRIPDETE
jgi:hypothetical protein